VTCHALAHTGALTVAGDRVSGFQWRVASEEATRSVRESLRELTRISDVRLVEPSPSSAQSDSPDAAIPQAIESEVGIALRGLGYSTEDAGKRASRARSRLAASATGLGTLTVERVLGEALRSGA